MKISNKKLYKHLYRNHFHNKSYPKTNNSHLLKDKDPTYSSGYVLISHEEMNILSRYILDYKNKETGGQLFGYWTYDGNPVVLFVLGPGPQAGHYHSFFMQDINYLRKMACLLKNKYGLDHVGEWHSHHQLGLSYPSLHDARNISTNIRKLGYSEFLLCIGTCSETESSINAFIFNSNKDEYDHIPWAIKDIESPFRKIMSVNDEHLFHLPRTEQPNMKRLSLKDTFCKKRKIDYYESYLLKQKGNAKIFNSIIHTLIELYPSNSFIPTVDYNKEVHIEVYFGDKLFEDIHFQSAFPLDPPLIYDKNGTELSNSAEWYFNGNILDSFITYYKAIKIYNYDECQ